MYITIEGRLAYRLNVGANDKQDVMIDRGLGWIAEPVLWTDRWIHCGQLIAIQESDNLAMNAEKFSEQVSLNPGALVFTSRYAKEYIAWLANVPAEHLSDIYQVKNMRLVCKSFVPLDMIDETKAIARQHSLESGSLVPDLKFPWSLTRRSASSTHQRGDASSSDGALHDAHVRH